MKNHNLLVSILGAAALISCSSEDSNNPSNGTTQYDLQNYSFRVGDKANNCKLQENSTLNCNARGAFGGIYSVSFQTPVGKPGAYVVMPPEGGTFGLNISPAGGVGCSQSVSHGGETYTCNFTIGVKGMALPGNTVYLQINGELGLARIITINII